MNICSKCGEKAEWVKLTHQCRKCIVARKKDWKRKKNKHKCAYCDKDFIPNSSCKECSVKCRILKRVSNVNDCWEWQGKITKCGYGEITINQKYRLVHRLSYEVFRGKIPEGLLVCHSCDNKKCINPDHLWVGTCKENIQDAKNKGLLPNLKGRKVSEETRIKLKNRRYELPKTQNENHWNNKLSNDDVLEIRKMLEIGFKQYEIANRYGVNSSVISKIKTGKARCHI